MLDAPSKTSTIRLISALLAFVSLTAGTALASNKDRTDDDGFSRNDSRSWPVTMTVAFDRANVSTGAWHSVSARFHGYSWTDWEVETLTGSDAGHCSKRTPHQFYEGYAGCDGPLHPVGEEDPLVPYGPSYYIRGGGPATWLGDGYERASRAETSSLDLPKKTLEAYRGARQDPATSGRDTQIAAFDSKTGWLVLLEQRLDDVTRERFRVISLE